MAYAIHFAGGTDHVLFGSGYSFERTDPFSVSCWFKSDQVPTGIASLLNNWNSIGWEVYTNASYQLGFRLTSTPTTSEIVVEGVDTVADGLWKHLVATYDGSSLASGVTLYINGSSVTGSVVRDNLTTTTVTATALRFGNDIALTRNLEGLMDEVAIYDKELSAGEVTTIYNGGDPPDLTSIGPFGDLVGYWLMGDGDTFPTILDSSAGSNNGTMTNMVAGDIVLDSPYIIAVDIDPDTPIEARLLDNLILAEPFWTYDPNPVSTVKYKMRAVADPGPGYLVWTVTGSPDFTGSSAPGAFIPGSVVIVSGPF